MLLGLKLGHISLCKEGILRGMEIEDLAGEPDERSAFRQWWALYDIACGRPDAARARFTESLRDRARTRKRTITKLFPLAHIAFAEGDDFLGLELVECGINQAAASGMSRYAESGRRLRARYFPLPA